ncbi:hypothetical protein [Sphingomonas metalli]|nr:hypothetical protein [Sphingomonas metalli]
MTVLGQLKIKEAAALLGRSAAYLQATTDPDKREQLSVRDLEQLDLAHHAKFGLGFPLYEALGRRLATSRAERFADAAEIGRRGAALARENGEAVTALLEAALVTGDRKRVEEALRQTEDVHREATSTMACLRAYLDRGAGTATAPDTS